MEESFVGLWSWLKWQWLLREETVSEPSPWSPVFSWSLYSQAFLWASLLFLAGLLVLVAWRSWTRGHGRSRGRGAWLKAGPDICLAACQRILVNLLLLCVLLSVPWEWVRLYQIEMAKKMAVLSEALASAVSRVVVQPMELGAQAVGRSLRLFMLEVPVQWQPPVLLLLLLCLLGYLCLHRGHPVPQALAPTPHTALPYK
ncbi:uncharacterized protein LOC136748632 isoform X3 [Amia ocellicauda]|uniref:uncharacterized protein LOC136748632 isoform X3 n=1 Tax=Amia ocellicauda TaxID=2972642 RepID=UPI003463AC30